MTNSRSFANVRDTSLLLRCFFFRLIDSNNGGGSERDSIFHLKLV